MASKSQNPVPPKFPLGVDDDAAGFGAATCFPMGQAGLRVGIQYPVGSIVVAGAGTAAADGVYLAYDDRGGTFYLQVDDPQYVIFCFAGIGWAIWHVAAVLYNAPGSTGSVPPTTGWTAVDGAAPVPTISIIT